MKEEDKELLLKDLCSRLPYGVICTDLRHGDSKITEVNTEDGLVYCPDFDEYVKVENCRLYLRPMSSMTDEEIDMMWDISENYSEAESSSKITDLLNKWNLDHHHLIEKGLAIEVTEENNPYEDRKYSNTKAH